MPRTAIVAQSIDADGLAPTYEAANVAGNSIENNRIVHIKNGGASPVTVTIPTPQTIGDLAVADRTLVIPNAGERFIHLSGDVYAQPAGAGIWLDYSAVTSVTVASFYVT